VFSHFYISLSLESCIQMSGYVYGKGSRGYGYYRLDSDDADNIIVLRLMQKQGILLKV